MQAWDRGNAGMHLKSAVNVPIRQRQFDAWGKIWWSFSVRNVSHNWQEVEMNISIVEKVVEQLKSLPQELQWRVLEFTRALSVSTPHGAAGVQLLRFAGTI